MIFFIMALIHGMRNLEKVVKDTEDALEREALEEISNHFHANAKIMDMAHHNATGHYRDICISREKRRNQQETKKFHFALLIA